MTKQLVRGFAKLGLLVVLTLVTAGISAQAQTLEYTLTANIPFEFLIANEKLPAGEYSFRRSRQSDGDQVIQIASRNGETIVSRITIPVTTLTPNKAGLVVFHRYGEQYFLAEIWPASGSTGRALPKTRNEREIARKAHENVTIVANVR